MAILPNVTAKVVHCQQFVSVAHLLTTDHFLMKVCGIREAVLELGEFA
jgi:hypothetical protein